MEDMIPPPPNEQLPDKADNHVMELAVAGGAEVVVTFNSD